MDFNAAYLLAKSDYAEKQAAHEAHEAHAASVDALNDARVVFEGMEAKRRADMDDARETYNRLAALSTREISATDIAGICFGSPSVPAPTGSIFFSKAEENKGFYDHPFK